MVKSPYPFKYRYKTCMVPNLVQKYSFNPLEIQEEGDPRSYEMLEKTAQSLIQKHNGLKDGPVRITHSEFGDGGAIRNAWIEDNKQFWCIFDVDQVLHEKIKNGLSQVSLKHKQHWVPEDQDANAEFMELSICLKGQRKGTDVHYIGEIDESNGQVKPQSISNSKEVSMNISAAAPFKMSTTIDSSSSSSLPTTTQPDASSSLLSVPPIPSSSSSPPSPPTEEKPSEEELNSFVTNSFTEEDKQRPGESKLDWYLRISTKTNRDRRINYGNLNIIGTEAAMESRRLLDEEREKGEQREAEHKKTQDELTYYLSQTTNAFLPILKHFASQVQLDTDSAQVLTNAELAGQQNKILPAEQQTTFRNLITAAAASSVKGLQTDMFKPLQPPPPPPRNEIEELKHLILQQQEQLNLITGQQQQQQQQQPPPPQKRAFNEDELRDIRLQNLEKEKAELMSKKRTRYESPYYNPSSQQQQQQQQPPPAQRISTAASSSSPYYRPIQPPIPSSQTPRNPLLQMVRTINANPNTFFPKDIDGYDYWNRPADGMMVNY